MFISARNLKPGDAVIDISPITIVILLLAVIALFFVFRRPLKALVTPKSDPDYAQKFAKLLIAELKLYNQPKLASAYRTGDIYQQLKPEIDRARKMYDKRVPLDATFGRDYFYEELVNGLAEGDATKLGAGYHKSGTYPENPWS
jgi:hypothetical protein